MDMQLLEHRHDMILATGFAPVLMPDPSKPVHVDSCCAGSVKALCLAMMKSSSKAACPSQSMPTGALPKGIVLQAAQCTSCNARL